MSLHLHAPLVVTSFYVFVLLWSFPLPWSIPLHDEQVGYGFGRGAYGISAASYHEAVRAVYRAPLADLVADFEGVDGGALAAIVGHYASPGG
jgi:hypothetical protein